MGSSVSTATAEESNSPNPNSDSISNSSNDPWSNIENENYSLSVPNLSELFSTSRDTKIIPPIIKNDRNASARPISAINAISETQIEDEKSSLIKREQSLEEFKEELREKRMARQSAVNDLRTEIKSLRQQLAEERELTRRLRNGEVVDAVASSSSSRDDDDQLSHPDPMVSLDAVLDESQPDEQPRQRTAQNLMAELAEIQLALQLANADNLSLTTELGVMRKQVLSLKEVITCCKQMINIKEDQVTQLRSKLSEIENSLAERELQLMSDNLRQEYDRQLENIRTLRQLYEERARVCAAERENLERQISIKKDELTSEIEKTKMTEERATNLEKELETVNAELKHIKEEWSEYKFENKTLKEEMDVVNKLFSQMLMGFNGQNNLDIDRLTTMLEENRTLLNEMATKEANSDGATLPKLLFDLVEQAGHLNSTIVDDDAAPLPAGDGGEPEEGDEDKLQPETENNGKPSVERPEVIGNKVASAQEIIGNLPKVWRVLMELLSHHKVEKVQIRENSHGEDCYKSVQTPNGPKAELSVSKTYIKLKDLILEKKSLQKETSRLKTLTSHVEYHLNEQEKRLSTVSLELTKTWHLVGKMQRQHRQLHTHEQILRYQLQQKRRHLTELKDELEYCRRKWAAARAKNDESQLQCDDLRREFARRKLEDASNSAESGYSDGPGSDDDDSMNLKKEAVKDLAELFVNPKKIERMQSNSPNRGEDKTLPQRRNSAPPRMGAGTPDQMDMSEAEAESTGAIPKRTIRKSRSKKSGSDEEDHTEATSSDGVKRQDRAKRIQRLEEQCKSLIAQVIETSDNREMLEIQLCYFQDEVGPAQHAVPLEEYISRKSEERVATVKSEEESSSSLTDKEEEYTRRRAERLERLEEESRQLMSRIKRTSDRGTILRNSLDRIHTRCVSSREGSVDEGGAGKEEENKPIESIDDRLQNVCKASNNRDERLKILEEESRSLLTKLSRTSNRGTQMIEHLDAREQNKALKSSEATAEHILPTPKTVASSSIVSEELTESVVITQIPSQIGAHQSKGAIPKQTSSGVQLSRSKRREKATLSAAASSASKEESLEEMFLRLSGLTCGGGRTDADEANSKANHKDGEKDSSERKDEGRDDDDDGREVV